MSTALKLVPVEPLTTPEGARAVARGSELSLEAPDGRVLVRYDAASGTLSFEGEAKVRLHASRLELTATEAVTLEAPRIEARAQTASWSVGRWEVEAARVRERAGDVYREVRGLAQTKAGRVRTVAEKTLEMFGRRASFKADEDVVVDGKRVLLG
ncbi:MAG TPA: hypothetical protein DEF51_20250 [Myxococcales bacterium]|nr:hypothetical protein [Myxococcales bacterium]